MLLLLLPPQQRVGLAVDPVEGAVPQHLRADLSKVLILALGPFRSGQRQGVALAAPGLNLSILLQGHGKADRGCCGERVKTVPSSGSGGLLNEQRKRPDATVKS